MEAPTAGRVTYRCCQHCVDPCPANGHSRTCGACSAGGVGRLPAVNVHYPPGTVRDWKVPGRRSPVRAVS